MIIIAATVAALALTATTYTVAVPVAADGLPTWTPEPTAVAPATVTPEPTVSVNPPGPIEPLPEPITAGGVLTEDQMVTVLRAAGWPEWAIPDAITIARCESGLNTMTTGAAGEVGLFQIHPVNWWRFGGGDGYDPYVNARAALSLWNDLGGRFGTTMGWFHCSNRYGIW